jgi:hypothetical protein
MGKNDITWSQANSTDVPPDPKCKQAEEPTYLSLNIGDLSDGESWNNIAYLIIFFSIKLAYF